MSARKNGQNVIVRSSQSGIWFGRLIKVEGTPDGMERVTLADARRIWCWQGAGSCSGLAAHGPREGKIAPSVTEAIVSGCCERLVVSEAAATQIASIAPWCP